MHAKDKSRKRRAKRGRKRAEASAKPRLSVFKSAQHIYAQLFDLDGKVVASASSASKVFKALPEGDRKGTKSQSAKIVGATVAKIAQEKNITNIAFDRSGYPYHGRVKALAEAAREAGLQF